MVSLRYSSPTKSKPRVEQTVSTQLCSSEGGPIGADEYVLAEVFQQDNAEQGTRGECLILTTFTLLKDESVLARQRVAAFLQPTDGAYFDALGRPVALYDYTYRHSRAARLC